MTLKNFLYLPIEVAARELDARLLIAHLAIQRGFEVIFGQKWLLYDNAGYVPPGAFLVKTLTEIDAAAMTAANLAGHFVVAIDEEMPGLVAAEQRLRWVSSRAVDAAGMIATTGDDHHDAMKRKFPAQADKMAICGNPRWDLLRPEFRPWHDRDVARIKAQYGRFLLINTNFGLLNSAKGSPEKVANALVRRGKLDLNRPEDVSYLEENRKVQQANMVAIDGLIHELPLQFPNHRIVLRPHPGENLQYWTRKFRDTPQIATVREGSAAPWILASDLLIHTGCTTGVEAFALGKPAISLQSIPSSREKLFLASKINLHASSVEEVIEVAERVLQPGAESFSYPGEFDDTFDKFIAARQGRFSTTMLLDALEERLSAFESTNNDRASWQPLPGYRSRIRRTPSRLQMMPNYSIDELAQRMDHFSFATGAKVEHVFESCGDRIYCVRAHRSGEKINPAPMWRALAQRWFGRNRRFDIP